MARLESAVAARSWRPQTFGRRSFREIEDPIVEPLWSGIRVLAHVDSGAAELIEASGTVRRDEVLEVALRTAIGSESAVLDGYVTPDAAAPGEGVYQGASGEGPTPSELTRQMIVGGALSHRPDRDERRGATAPVEAIESHSGGAGDRLVLVAVDLLVIDGESVLDVPLLERKRLLDAVIDESDLVRRGIHVRLPIDTWVTTWRSMGFRAMTYKAANSRYHPGAPNEDWATAALPSR